MKIKAEQILKENMQEIEIKKEVLEAIKKVVEDEDAMRGLSYSMKILPVVQKIINQKRKEFIKEIEEIVRAYLCKYTCRDEKLRKIRDGILKEIKQKGDLK